MTIRITLLLFMLCSSFQLRSQIELESITEVKEYLEGEWQLRIYNGGWAGIDYYPTDLLDYRFEFASIEESDSTMTCHGILNQEVLESTIVTIIYNENLYWGIENLPKIFDYYFMTFFMFEEAVTLDSFDIHDAAFDGISMRLAKPISTFVEDNSSEAFSVNIFPNPATDFVHIEVINGVKIKNVKIYNAEGCLLQESDLEGSERVNLPDVSGLLLIEVHLTNGMQERKMINKL